MPLSLLFVAALLQSPEPTPEFQRFDNGLRVCVVADHALPLISVQVWYRVGSAYDVPGRAGLCHVTRTILEHRDEAALRLRAAGVQFEGRTLRDACCFASVLPATSEFLEYVLKIEAARMQPLKATPEMVASGLAAAAREYGLTPDDPAQATERRLLAAMFPHHPYENPPGLVAEALQDLSPDDVNEFLGRWFMTGNATLFIVGDVQPPQAFELARKYFAALPWAEPPRHVESKSPEPGTTHVDAQNATADAAAGLDVAWLAPPLSAAENSAIDVLMHRLCNPVDGPLYRRLIRAGCSPPRWRRESWRDGGMLVMSVDVNREAISEAPKTRQSLAGRASPWIADITLPQPQRGERDGAMVSAGFLSPLRDSGIDWDAFRGLAPPANRFRPAGGAIPNTASAPSGAWTNPLTEVETVEKTAATIERSVKEEIRRAAETIPSPIELNRARALAARDLRSRRASFADRALDLGIEELIAGDVLRAELENPAIQAASVGELQAAAHLLSEARAVILRHAPLLTGTQPATQPTEAGLPRPLASEPAVPLDGAAALELVAQHATDAPQPVSPKAPVKVVSAALENGVCITICTARGQEPATVRTIVSAPSYLRDGLHAVMAVGSTGRSAAQCRDYLSYHGLDLLPLAERGRCGLESRGPSISVAQMIELQAELLRSPDRSQAAYQAAYDRLHALSDLRTRTRTEARAEELYLPPNMIGWREPGLFRPINLEEVAMKLEELTTINRVEVFVVGDMMAESVLAAVREAWADWKPGPPGSGGSGERDALTALAAVTGTPRTVTQWTTDPLERPVIVMQDMLNPDGAPGTLGKLTLQAAGRCLGAPDERSMTLGPDRTFRWHCTLTWDDSFVLAADVPAAGLADVVATALGRADRVQTSQVPHFADALRLARVDRLVTLDNTAAIADLLEYGVAAPWNLLDEQNAGDIAQALPKAYRVWMRVIAGTGPRDFSAELRRFERPASGTSSRGAP